ncbi:MAG: hypothetical protein GXY03_07690 [Solirubrobacterales bacterium]|nr:hypothetical protein [Solirubrobacterales bacterium]
MRRWAGLGVAVLAAIGASAPTAQAQQFGIESFTGMVFADDARDRSDAYTNTGTPGGRTTDAYPDPGTGGTGIYELAGGHPYIGVTDFSFNRESPGGPPAGGNVDNLRVDIPRGLMPNPRAFDRCTEAELQAHNCPVSSQIGTEELTLYIGALHALTGDITLQIPLYNMTPLSNPEGGEQEDVVARFAFDPAEAGEALAGIPALSGLVAALLDLHPVHIVGGVRDEPSGFGPFDYGLYFTIEHLPAYDGGPTSPGVLRTNLTFWGAPGDPAHDAERGVSCVGLPTMGLSPCTPLPPPGSAPDPALPFLSNPTECTGQALQGRLTVYSQPQGDGTVLSDTRTDQTPEIVDRDDGTVKSGAQECQQLTLAPALDLGPQLGPPDSPAGPEVTIAMANEGLADRDRFAESHARDIVLTLPPGLTINPSAANGLEACTDAQLAVNVGVPGGEACPPASRIGDVRVVSPLLPPAADEPDDSVPALTGSAYVGQPLPGDRYRLFVTVEGRKVSIRLKGSVRPDARTGQVTAVFRDNPQLPFEELAVDLRDGPRAPLATPQGCGPAAASLSVVPWSGTAPVVAGTQSPVAGPGCPPGFAPAFGAATGTAAGGAFSPLTVAFSRADRNQFLSGVRVDPPPGLAARIRGVEQCADAAARTGACPAASRIGTATTAAGAGPEPYRLSGPVYLTEGYKGGAFGMVAVIRAIAGPFDLGTVVVRQAIFVDPEDASLTVVSDPLPQILEGVPIRLRDVSVRLDRPRFAYNPTSCGTKSVGGRLTSAAGTTVDRAATLAIAGCERLAFGPRMRMQLLGPRQMRQSRHPGLKVTLTQPDGQANVAGAVVKLPRSLALDPANAQAVCGFEAGLRAVCPKASRIGTAVASSPALNRQLRGPVYFVQGIRIDPTTGARIRTLPSLLAKLHGEIRLNLRGTTDVEGGRLVSTFAAIPDAPVSRFVMRLKGGRGGVLAATGRPAICGRRQVSDNRLTGHNGKVAGQRRVAMVKPCRPPKLRLRRVRAAGQRLVVRGTIARRAAGRIAVAARCGKARNTRRAKRPRKGRWAAALRLPRACGSARRAKLRVVYRGGGAFRPAARGRTVTLRAGS